LDLTKFYKRVKFIKTEGLEYLHKKMKKIKKPKKSIQKVFTESQVGALLEDMNDNIKIIAENQIGINEKLENHDHRFDNLEGRFDNLEGRFVSFQKETRENFKFIAKRLMAIENSIEEIKEELNKKADKEWVEKKIKFLEKELASLRKVVFSK